MIPTASSVYIRASKVSNSNASCLGKKGKTHDPVKMFVPLLELKLAGRFNGQSLLHTVNLMMLPYSHLMMSLHSQSDDQRFLNQVAVSFGGVVRMILSAS